MMDKLFSNDLRNFDGPDMATNDREDLAYRQQLADGEQTRGTARADMALGSQYGESPDMKRGVKAAADSNPVQDYGMRRNGGQGDSQSQTVGMQPMGNGNFRSAINEGSGDDEDRLNQFERGAEASVDDERVPEQVDRVTSGRRPQEHDITEAQSQGQMYEKARTRQQ